ncbi:MAG: T9SS type A sorting domain-containing protein [bacterium]
MPRKKSKSSPQAVVRDIRRRTRLSLDPAHGIHFTLGPNPANPITWISYNLPYPQKAEIAVYNLLGQKVATLASGLQMPGSHRIPWVADDVASGVYWVRMEVSPSAGLGTIRLQSEAKKVVVVR